MCIKSEEGIILVDTLIQNKLPKDLHDYGSLQIGSLVNPPIVSEIGLSVKKKRGNKLYLEWNNNKLDISYEDIKASLENVLSCKTFERYKTYFKSIEVEREQLVIDSSEVESVEILLSHPKFGLVIEGINFGYYIWENEETLVLNDLYPELEGMVPKIIKLKLLSEVEEHMHIIDYEENVLSCPTYFSFNRIKKDTCVEENNLRVCLEVPNKQIKNEIKKIRFDEDEQLMKGWSFFTNQGVEKQNSVMKKTKMYFLIPNYYPNGLLAQKISKVLGEKGYEVIEIKMEFFDFLKEDKTKYDLVLCIKDMFSDNLYESTLQHLGYVENKKEYIELYDFVISGDVGKEKLEKYQDEHSKLLVIAKCNNIYIKKGNMKNFAYKKNGAIEIKNIFI